MKTYTVLVDALGYAGGCAKKDEVVTEEQVGVENADRLLREGFISANFVSTPEAPAKAAKTEAPAKDDAPAPPASMIELFSVGIPPAAEYELSEEELAWALAVQDGTAPAPFDEKATAALTGKEILARIEGLGFETPSSKAKKAELLDALRDAIAGYFDDWDLKGPEEEEKVEETEEVETSDKAEGDAKEDEVKEEEKVEETEVAGGGSVSG
ncbi:MAG: hypothetical protein ABL984_00280 [Pyrinomonadaceae bacterium]